MLGLRSHSVLAHLEWARPIRIIKTGWRWLPFPFQKEECNPRLGGSAQADSLCVELCEGLQRAGGQPFSSSSSAFLETFQRSISTVPTVCIRSF